jgi:energy-coupling factor transport system permease protein
MDMIFQYQQGVSLFHRLDPLSKFVWLMSISILSIGFENVLAQAVLLLTVILTGVYLAGLPLHSIWKGIRIPFWFGIPYFGMQLVFLSGETELVRLWGLVLTTEALDYAGAVSLRLLILVLASLLFIATTDPRDLVLVLAQKLFVPYRFAYSISIALRFLPILEAEAALIRAAQRLRGLGEPKGFRNKLAWQKRFAAAVFISAVRRVEKTAIVMELKGFGLYSDRTYRHFVTISPAGIILSITSSAACLVLVWYS